MEKKLLEKINMIILKKSEYRTFQSTIKRTKENWESLKRIYNSLMRIFLEILETILDLVPISD